MVQAALVIVKNYEQRHQNIPEYTRRYLPVLKQNPYDFRRSNIFAEERTNTSRYTDSFYPYCIKAWTNLDPTIWNLPIISQFKKALLQFIRPEKRHRFGMNDRVVVNLLTRLRVDLSNLKLHKFDHRSNCASLSCSCGQAYESTVHFFLHCQLYIDLRRGLLDSVSEVICNDVRVYPDQYKCHFLLYGSKSFNSVANRMILRYIKDSERFKIFKNEIQLSHHNFRYKVLAWVLLKCYGFK